MSDQYGNAVPVDSEERRKINSFAKQMLRLILNTKEQWEINNNTIIFNEDWIAPKRHLSRMTFEGLEKEYKLLLNRLGE